MNVNKNHIFRGQIFKVDTKLSEYVEKNKKSLPGSPFWNIDMNPGCLPDGDFSEEKREEFDKEIRRLIFTSQFTNKTFIENMVERKRRIKPFSMF